MLYAESIHAAVKETALLFEISQGRDDLKLFLRALAEKLEQRGKPEAVAVLQDFIERGCSREIEVHGRCLRLPVSPPRESCKVLAHRRVRRLQRRTPRGKSGGRN